MKYRLTIGKAEFSIQFRINILIVKDTFFSPIVMYKDGIGISCAIRIRGNQT
jgi:hypothetical protein